MPSFQRSHRPKKAGSERLAERVGTMGFDRIGGVISLDRPFFLTWCAAGAAPPRQAKPPRQRLPYLPHLSPAAPADRAARASVGAAIAAR